VREAVDRSWLASHWDLPYEEHVKDMAALARLEAVAAKLIQYDDAVSRWDAMSAREDFAAKHAVGEEASAFLLEAIAAARALDEEQA